MEDGEDEASEEEGADEGERVDLRVREHERRDDLQADASDVKRE